MIANIGSDDALILPHRANPAGLNFRERQVLNAEHLRRILAKYPTYHHEVRTHVSLGKDPPCRRPAELFGDIVAYPALGGLHHRHARVDCDGVARPLSAAPAHY